MNQRSLPLAESRETLLKILIVDIWRGLSIYVRSVDQDICFIVASPLLRREEESVVCINVYFLQNIQINRLGDFEILSHRNNKNRVLKNSKLGVSENGNSPSSSISLITAK